MPSPPMFAAALWLAVAATACAEPATTKRKQPLHSDGGTWGFHPAHDRRDERPDVLLIGDSIMNGYRGEVASLLEKDADVDYWLTPMHVNSKGLHRKLKFLLTARKYDVIHFNLGLHGWQEERVPTGQYAGLLSRFVAILKDRAPQATLIWASTTPVHARGTQELNQEINPTITRRNGLAAVVMKEQGVAINDLYGLTVERLDLVRGDRFHWKGPAYELMAQQIAERVRSSFPVLQSE